MIIRRSARLSIVKQENPSVISEVAPTKQKFESSNDSNVKKRKRKYESTKLKQSSYSSESDNETKLSSGSKSNERINQSICEKIRNQKLTTRRSTRLSVLKQENSGVCEVASTKQNSKTAADSNSKKHNQKYKSTKLKQSSYSSESDNETNLSSRSKSNERSICEEISTQENSSDEFLSEQLSPKPQIKRKSQKKTKKVSTVNKKSLFKTIIDEHKSSIDSGSSSDTGSNWEEVDNRKFNELDYVKEILDTKNDIKSSLHDSAEPATLTVTVSTSKLKNNPEKAASLAIKRKLRDDYMSMHLVNIYCFLAHGRYLNSLCDSVIYKAIGLSLLHNVKSIYDNMNQTVFHNAEWTEDHLKACLITILSRENTELMNDLFKNNINTSLTKTDCTILFIAALRSLGFDVRLVVGLNPLPIKPSSRTSTEVYLKAKDKKLSCRQIISSESEDEPFEIVDLQSSIIVMAEVFLPLRNKWICINPYCPTKNCEKLSYSERSLYTVGICSTSSLYYIGRNPVDLSARYDPDWCIASRPNKISSERWIKLLKIQSSFYDADALKNNCLVPASEAEVLVEHDEISEEMIQEKLLHEKLPTTMEQYKNHPLFILPRHLLKFQVLYPPDVVPVHFFRNEPVYSRNAVHLCHTRESWLKEAMVVRAHEKPAKLVKARQSMKRKLLQGFDKKPQTVEIFGEWQVDPYEPPTAKDGIVPRSVHGTVDLFKPSMLPHGCVHINLTGIQYIARRLGIDCAPAMVGWTFHGAGWAHPQTLGYVVCKENVPVLLKAWKNERMHKAKAAQLEKSERAIANWRRLVRGLFIWNRVRAQFALLPSQPNDVFQNDSNPSSLHQTKRKQPNNKRNRKTTKSANDQDRVHLDPLSNSQLFPLNDIEKNQNSKVRPTRCTRSGKTNVKNSENQNVTSTKLPLSDESDSSSDDFID